MIPFDEGSIVGKESRLDCSRDTGAGALSVAELSSRQCPQAGVIEEDEIFCQGSTTRNTVATDRDALLGAG